MGLSLFIYALGSILNVLPQHGVGSWFMISRHWSSADWSEAASDCMPVPTSGNALKHEFRLKATNVKAHVEAVAR